LTLCLRNFTPAEGILKARAHKPLSRVTIGGKGRTQESSTRSPAALSPQELIKVAPPCLEREAREVAFLRSAIRLARSGATYRQSPRDIGRRMNTRAVLSLEKLRWHGWRRGRIETWWWYGSPTTTGASSSALHRRCSSRRGHARRRDACDYLLTRRHDGPGAGLPLRQL